MTEHKGDGAAFDKNWKDRPETSYLHWTRGEPENQIQLAFRQHWLTFNELLANQVGEKRCLEVGCGRGSLSAYFADDGWNCTLLDISETAIKRAKQAFEKADLKANFDIGDCLDLPYPDGSFDLVFSIGLLEHFEDFNLVISEQTRVLDEGGMFIGYVVPHLPDCIQKDYEWVNQLLKAIMPEESAQAISGKTEVYRSDALSPPYIKSMKDAGLKKIKAAGAYPLPMVSHSIDFPFSLLPEVAERTLVHHFKDILGKRAAEGSNPWLCEEGEGQAFLLWGRK
tara:strand:- start:5432 stop:6277 length:846 start_codon:yes stop_codon:yes gene_type:complete